MEIFLEAFLTHAEINTLIRTDRTARQEARAGRVRLGEACCRAIASGGTRA